MYLYITAFENFVFLKSRYRKIIMIIINFDTNFKNSIKVQSVIFHISLHKNVLIIVSYVLSFISLTILYAFYNVHT